MRRPRDKRPAGRLLRFVGLTLLLVAPVTLLVLKHTRETIATALWYAVWLGNLAYRAIPQDALWILFLVAALAIACASLFRRAAQVDVKPVVELDRPGRVQSLAHMIRRMDRSLYLRWQLARLLGGLTLETAAQRLPAEGAKGLLERLLADETTTSPEIRAYLLAGLGRWPYEHTGCLQWVRRVLRISAPIGVLGLDPERAVQFLEEHGSRLEVFHDR